jgi:hypothetical protein
MKILLKARIAVKIPYLRHSLIIPLSFAAGAKSFLQAYVYHISENGIKLVDTNKAFEEAHEDHPHPGESEMSVKGQIE